MKTKKFNILIITLLVVSLSFIGAETLSLQQANVSYSWGGVSSSSSSSSSGGGGGSPEVIEISYDDGSAEGTSGASSPAGSGVFFTLPQGEGTLIKIKIFGSYLYDYPAYIEIRDRNFQFLKRFDFDLSDYFNDNLLDDWTEITIPNLEVENSFYISIFAGNPSNIGNLRLGVDTNPPQFHRSYTIHRNEIPTNFWKDNNLMIRAVAIKTFPKTEQCGYDSDCKLFYNICTCNYECIPKDTYYLATCLKICEEKPTIVPKCKCVNNECKSTIEIKPMVCKEGEIEYHSCSEGFIENLWIKRKCLDGGWINLVHLNLYNLSCSCKDNSVCKEGYGCVDSRCQKLTAWINVTDINITLTKGTTELKTEISSNFTLTKPIKRNCEGCFLDDNCLPIGYRTNDEYCDTGKSLKNQKQQQENCNNNFECKSNICVDGKCLSGGLIHKILDFFRRLFGL